MQETEKAQRALDWPLDDMDVMTKTLDELPVSPNSLLPEYQLTQEWFDRVVEELREVEEVKVAGEDVAGTGDMVSHAGHERH